MQTEEEQAFLSDILKLSYEPTGSTAITRDINPEDSTVTERDSIVYTSPNVKGLGLQFSYYNELNAQHYAATHPEILKPVGNYAFTAMQYDTGTSAAVATRALLTAASSWDSRWNASSTKEPAPACCSAFSNF